MMKNQSNHNIFSIIIFLFSGLFLLAGCGGGGSTSGGDGGRTSVSVSFNIPSANSAKSVFAQSVPVVVKSIVIVISASDMATITDTFNVSSGSTITRNYSVPTGSGRTILAKAYSGSMGTGNLLYLGETTVNLSGESASVLINMVLSDIFEALNVLNSGDIVGANDLFRAAVLKYAEEGTNNEDTANFFYALTRVAAIGFDIESDGVNDGLNDSGDILDAFDCSQTGRDPYDIDAWDLITCPAILPSNHPTGPELRAFFNNVVSPELEGAMANLDAVSQSFNIAWTEPFNNDNVESDYGDVLFVRAVAKGAMAELLNHDAYDSNIDINDDIDANTWQSILANNPNAPLLTNAVNLGNAQSYIDSGLDDLDAAIDWIQAETDDQSDDWINLVNETQQEIDDAKDDIATAKTCINGQCTLDNDTPSDSDDSIIDGSLYFAGLNLRSLIPSFIGNDPIGFLPDPTFGGVLILYEGEDPSVFNDDLDEDSTADIFEEDFYYVYGGGSITPNFEDDPESQGFTLLGVANAAIGATVFSGAYSYYYIRSSTKKDIKNFGPINPSVHIDAFEFLGSSSEYCCSLQWWCNAWWCQNLEGADDNVGTQLSSGNGFVFMTAPPGTTGIRVYGLP